MNIPYLSFLSPVIHNTSVLVKASITVIKTTWEGKDLHFYITVQDRDSRQDSEATMSETEALVLTDEH